MTTWLQAMHRILLLTNRLIFEGLGPGVKAAPPSSTVFCPALEPTADEDGDGDGDDDEGEAADEDIAAADFVVAARENLSSKLHAAFAAPPDAPAWDTAAVASSSFNSFSNSSTDEERDFCSLCTARLYVGAGAADLLLRLMCR